MVVFIRVLEPFRESFHLHYTKFRSKGKKIRKKRGKLKKKKDCVKIFESLLQHHGGKKNGIKVKKEGRKRDDRVNGLLDPLHGLVPSHTHLFL